MVIEYDPQTDISIFYSLVISYLMSVPLLVLLYYGIKLQIYLDYIRDIKRYHRLFKNWLRTTFKLTDTSSDQPQSIKEQQQTSCFETITQSNNLSNFNIERNSQNRLSKKLQSSKNTDQSKNNKSQRKALKRASNVSIVKFLDQPKQDIIMQMNHQEDQQQDEEMTQRYNNNTHPHRKGGLFLKKPHQNTDQNIFKTEMTFSNQIIQRDNFKENHQRELNQQIQKSAKINRNIEFQEDQDYLQNQGVTYIKVHKITSSSNNKVQQKPTFLDRSNQLSLDDTKFKKITSSQSNTQAQTLSQKTHINPKPKKTFRRQPSPQQLSKNLMIIRNVLPKSTSNPVTNKQIQLQNKRIQSKKLIPRQSLSSILQEQNIKTFKDFLKQGMTPI